MNRRGPRLAVAMATLTLVAVGAPAHAQLTVFDPSNFAENVLTAANTLQQINNQIRSLQNQATALDNQAKNLANLPYSSLQQLQQSLQQTQALLAQAQNIAFDVRQVQSAFSTTYAPTLTGLSDQVLINNAQTRWQNSVGAFEDTLKVQAGVVGNLSTAGATLSALVSASQSASGALQAAQAGNQLVALQVQQLSDLTALVAGQSRAQALEQTRQAADEAQGREQFNRFVAPQPYAAQPVQMFDR